jgi:hypothetical protein
MEQSISQNTARLIDQQTNNDPHMNAKHMFEKAQLSCLRRASILDKPLADDKTKKEIKALRWTAQVCDSLVTRFNIFIPLITGNTKGNANLTDWELLDKAMWHVDFVFRSSKHGEDLGLYWQQAGNRFVFHEPALQKSIFDIAVKMKAFFGVFRDNVDKALQNVRGLGRANSHTRPEASEITYSSTESSGIAYSSTRGTDTLDRYATAGAQGTTGCSICGGKFHTAEMCFSHPSTKHRKDEILARIKRTKEQKAAARAKKQKIRK